MKGGRSYVRLRRIRIWLRRRLCFACSIVHSSGHYRMLLVLKGSKALKKVKRTLHLPFFTWHYVKVTLIKDEINRIVKHTLIVRKTPGCFSSGISFCKHSLFVILLMLYRIIPAKTIKAAIYNEGNWNSSLQTFSVRIT